MRDAEFKKLVLDGYEEIAGLEMLLKDSSYKLPSGQTILAPLQYMNRKGIDDDGIRKLIPGIIKYLADNIEIFREKSKEELKAEAKEKKEEKKKGKMKEEKKEEKDSPKELLETHIDSLIEQLDIPIVTTKPERMRNEVEKLDRRRDLLARILAPNDVNTPCLAVTFHHGQLVISYNSPTKKHVEKSSIEKNIQIKINIIRDLIANATISLQNKDANNVQKLITEARIKIFELNDHSTSALLPKKSRAKRKKTLDDFYETALRKLIESATTTAKDGGFTNQDIDALLLSKDVTFLSPSFEKENTANASLHAEQMLASYIKANKSDDDPPAYIGISKLCCANCRDVLKETPEVRFRGSHGSNFPNIMDVRSGTKMPEYPKTLPPETQYASDSESEGELDVQEVHDPFEMREKKRPPLRAEVAPHKLPLTLFSMKIESLVTPAEPEEKIIEEEKRGQSPRSDKR